MEDVICE